MKYVVFDSCHFDEHERERIIEVFDHFIDNPPPGKEHYIRSLVRLRNYLVDCTQVFIGDYE